MRAFIRTMFFLLFVAVATQCLAQASSDPMLFAYKKTKVLGKPYHTLKGDADSISVTTAIESRSTRLRQVRTADSGGYYFNYNKLRKQDEILTHDGTVLATTRAFYNVTLPDGRYYGFVAVSNKEWRYNNGSKDVLVGRYKKQGSLKQIELTWLVPAEERLGIITMMAQVYGVNLIQDKASQPLVYTVSFAVGFAAGAALGSSRSQETP